MHDEEGRAFLQDRLAFYAAVGALFFLVTACARWLVLGYGSPAERAGLDTGSRVFFGVTATLAAAWAGCRWGRHSTESLRTIEIASLFLTGLLLASLGIIRLATFDLTYPIVMHVALALIARSVIVPSSAFRTLALSLGAAGPALLAVAAKAARSGRSPGLGGSGADAAIQAGWLIAAIGLSVLASRVTYGLRAEVREARQVGQYTLGSRLGEGAMGVVYLARHARLKRPTAVKLLAPSKVGHQTVERFEREVQITARLTHPNTVAVYDYGRTIDGVFYYAMEYLEGVSLEKLVEDDGPQPPARVVHIVRQIAGALSEAHALGLVHRDVKPANIILCERGGVPDVAKVLDFGLVKDHAIPAGAALTQSNVFVGTPLYMAPEALNAPDQVGPRTDLYALGAVAYHLLTGGPLFTGNVVQVLGHHLHTPPVPPSERLGRVLPGSLEKIVLSCLEKDPERRPRDAPTLRDALDAAGVPPWTEADARAWWVMRGARRDAEAAATRGRGRATGIAALLPAVERTRA